MHDQHHRRGQAPRAAATGRRGAVIGGAGLAITALTAAASALAGTAGGGAPGAITVTTASDRPAAPGSAAYFTGSTIVQPLFPANEPTRASGGSVTFEPGARSAWHTHPLGQVLVVTAGSGWVQLWGSPKQEIRQGDVVWIPPGVKHWHGARADAGLTHIAIQEQLDGRNVDWLEHVTDAQYRG
jgi:quercetin dioxygenase-like cupin family protein